MNDAAVSIVMGIHGRISTYTNYDCRCADCRRAHRLYMREQRGSNPETSNNDALDRPWILVNFPVAIVARQAWPDDAAAIAAAFGEPS